MKTKFLHAADFHLGYRQYGLDARYNDFGRAFLDVVDTAVQKEVDFVLLAGDIFHAKQVEPQTLGQAMMGLVNLQNAGIPVYAIEGNHDGPRHRYRRDHSWLSFLDGYGYLHLLSMDDDGFFGGENVPVLGLRILGLPYLGAATSRYVEEAASRLAEVDDEGVKYTIFVMHVGMEGILPASFDTLTHDTVAPLRDYVDYLALGHIHKAYSLDDWIYNPGSPEACSTREGEWTRGCHLVEVDTERACHNVTLIKNKSRPFHTFDVDISKCDSPEALYAHVRIELEEQVGTITAGSKPVVQLSLTGRLKFNRSNLRLEQVVEIAEEVCDALKVIPNDQMDFQRAVGPTLTHSNREELERGIFVELARRDGYGPRTEAWARLIGEVKEMSLQGQPADEMAEHISTRLGKLQADGENGNADSSG